MMASTEAIDGGWRAGLTVGAGLAAGSFLLAVSFGAFAVTHGWPAALAIAMSLLVFSGSAQFALVTAFAGGGIVPGLLGAALMNLRFVPMAAATARYLHGGRWQRALEGQSVVDGSWVAAQRPDGTLDRSMMIAATLVQWPAWVAGTAIGALAVPSTSFIQTTGLDLVFPGFFLVLLVDALAGRPRIVPVAIAAAAGAAAACRFLPTGIALLLASAAVVLTLLPPRPSTAAPEVAR
jgi:4-azaleucine resistance transporter AzlC